MSDAHLARHTITLLTDFGFDAPYVGSMKGVILSIQPVARIVDISHSVGPQNVRQAAWLLAEASRWFPPGSIHVAVVDPGVGTRRAIVAAEIDRRYYIAPDNGLLSLLARRHRPERLFRVENPAYRLAEVSRTFHGRDIMAPAAAHLSRGVALEAFGPPLDALTAIDWPRPQRTDHQIRGQILWIDSFGNLITNIDSLPAVEGTAAGKPRVACGTVGDVPLVEVYGQRPVGELVALVGSSGLLELAVVNGSAAARLGANVGDEVIVSW